VRIFASSSSGSETTRQIALHSHKTSLHAKGSLGQYEIVLISSEERELASRTRGSEAARKSDGERGTYLPCITCEPTTREMYCM
jgi:hypothetical protein